jgi:hypothetical protein
MVLTKACPMKPVPPVRNICIEDLPCLVAATSGTGFDFATGYPLEVSWNRKFRKNLYASIFK